MDNIMVLKDHLDFKYVHSNIFLGQSKGKEYVFKLSVHSLGSGVDFVKHMQVGEDMENSWIIFDHVKHLKNWITLACHVYDTEYCKVL